MDHFCDNCIATPEIAAIANQTLLRIEFGKGQGSGVLVAPCTAITAAHVIPDDTHEITTITRLTTGENAAIADMIIYAECDVAIITLTKMFEPPFAPILPPTEEILNPFLPYCVTMPYYKGGSRDGKSTPQIAKPRIGFFTHADREVNAPQRNGETFKNGEERRKTRRCVMRMKAKSGNSGAGIFTEEGGIITILTNTHQRHPRLHELGLPSRESCGPRVNDFMHIAHKHGLVHGHT